MIPDDYDSKKDSIELVPYNHDWPMKAVKEIKLLQSILPCEQIIDIQHVGSTAIPEIMAKPIIDIQIAAKSLEAIKLSAIPILKNQDYEYWKENPDPERLFFVKGMPPFGEKRTHHIHIVEPSSRHWIEKILFRDYLIKHSDAKREYEILKQKLAQQYRYDREAYTDAKKEFIDKILLLACKDK